ncbi:unnamed protein product, partial [Amoebophrya sp. A25]
HVKTPYALFLHHSGFPTRQNLDVSLNKARRYFEESGTTSIEAGDRGGQSRKMEAVSLADKILGNRRALHMPAVSPSPEGGGQKDSPHRGERILVSAHEMAYGFGLRVAEAFFLLAEEAKKESKVSQSLVRHAAMRVAQTVAGAAGVVG